MGLEFADKGLAFRDVVISGLSSWKEGFQYTAQELLHLEYDRFDQYTPASEKNKQLLTSNGIKIRNDAIVLQLENKKDKAKIKLIDKVIFTDTQDDVYVVKDTSMMCYTLRENDKGVYVVTDTQNLNSSTRARKPPICHKCLTTIEGDVLENKESDTNNEAQNKQYKYVQTQMDETRRVPTVKGSSQTTSEAPAHNLSVDRGSVKKQNHN